MKRKIFSKLLMGALLVASISSFTSCKDYDDDIKKNTDDISALTKQISTLETALNTTKQEAAANYATKTEIAKLATAEALQKSINDLQAKIQGNSSKTIAELAADIDAINPKLNTLGSTIETIQGAAQAAIKNLEMQQTVLDRLQKEVEGDGSSIAGLKDDVATLKDEVAKVKNVIGSVTSLDELAQKMTELSNKIDDSIDVLTVLVSGTLKSLVFQPDYYFGGVEATEAAAIFYTPLAYETEPATNGADFTYNKNDGKTYYIEKVKQLDAGTTIANFNASWIAAADVVKPVVIPDGTAVNTSKKFGILTPNVIASYHMNPSTVKKENIKDVTVISDDKMYITRTAASKPAVKSWDAVNGILTAEIGLTYKDIAKNGPFATDPGTGNDIGGNVTVFAAQAHYKDAVADTTITSDYAAISPVAITNLIIADNSTENAQRENHGTAATANQHVWRQAADAIGNLYAHKIPWNSKGFDLSEVIELHYDKIFYADDQFQQQIKKTDNIATKDQLKHWGFEFKYTLVEYTQGTNLTEETLPHMKLNGSVVTPTGVNGTQTRASVGREPLVKIELVNTNNKNQLVQIGYVKFHITAEEAPAAEIEVFKAAKHYTCQIMRKELAWNTVEGVILDNAKIRASGIAKTTFENVYALDEGNVTTDRRLDVISAATTTALAVPYIKVGDKWVPITVTTFAGYDELVATGDDSPNRNFFLFFSGQDNTYSPTTNVMGINMSKTAKAVFLAKKNPKYNGTTVTDAYLKPNGQATDNINDAAKEDQVTLQLAMRLYDQAEGGYPDVFVIFNVKLSKLELTLNKIADYWYASNNVLAKTGFDEIHISVPVIGETGADVRNFRGDFCNTIVKNVLGIYPVTNPQDEAGFIESDLDNDERGYYDNANAAQPSYPNNEILAYQATSAQPATDYSVNPIETTLKFVAKGSTKAAFTTAPTTPVAFAKDAKGDEATGYTGKTYLLVPATDGQSLAAVEKGAAGKYDGTITKVASIQVTLPTTSVKAKYEFVVEDNPIARDLVNFASHKDLANTFTAHVTTEAKLKCDNNIPVIVTNPDFDVKFLRPLDIEGHDAQIFRDATDGGNILNLIDLIKFNDWREQWAPKFGATDKDLFNLDADGNPVYTSGKYVGKDRNYYRYYQVAGIEADIAGITTDMNGGTLGTTLLSTVTTNAQFSNIAGNVGRPDRLYKMLGHQKNAGGAWSGADYGTTAVDCSWADPSLLNTSYVSYNNIDQLKYENNQTTVGTFKVRVPLIVTYYWGKVKTYVDLDVKNTLEN